jgi:hypothetical protein
VGETTGDAAEQDRAQRPVPTREGGEFCAAQHREGHRRGERLAPVRGGEERDADAAEAALGARVSAVRA